MCLALGLTIPQTLPLRADQAIEKMIVQQF
jgi:hypothetical protein